MIKEVLGVVVLGLGFDLLNLGWRKTLNSNIRFDMILYEVRLTFLVHPLISMCTEAVHVSVSIRDTALREEEHNVLDAFRGETDEVP